MFIIGVIGDECFVGQVVILEVDVNVIQVVWVEFVIDLGVDDGFVEDVMEFVVCVEIGYFIEEV